MILDDVFQFLRSAGLAPTHAAFSTDYLGHSPRYYDYLRCSGVAPSLRALLRLAMRLSDISHATGDSLNGNVAGQLAKRVMASALSRCR